MSVAEKIDPATADTILSVNNIEVIYNHVILVLKGVSLTVPRGGIVALLGANGAGKTTTLRAVSNLLHGERGEVTKGSITFNGDEVQTLTPNELVRRGCIQVMEGRHCFEHLTIEDNLLTAIRPENSGAPLASAIPRHSGSATKKTTMLAGRSAVREFSIRARHSIAHR